MGGPARVHGRAYHSTDNFLIAPTTVDDLVYPSAEHYYQFAKFDQARGVKGCPAHCEAIRLAPSGEAAWSLGQSRKFPLIPDFERHKAALMYRGVRAKFHQHPGLAAELLSTGSSPITAAPSTADWQRTNSLILERVREELRIAAGVDPAPRPDERGAGDGIGAGGAACSSFAVAPTAGSSV